MTNNTEISEFLKVILRQAIENASSRGSLEPLSEYTDAYAAVYELFDSGENWSVHDYKDAVRERFYANVYTAVHAKRTAA